MILDGADEVFSHRFMRELARAKILIEHEIAFGLAGEDRLFAAIALAEYDVCTRAKSGAQRKSTARLVRELDRQILPDGGHISRNPDTLIRLLLDLLPLRQAYVAQAVPVPDPLVNAIDRMLPMLRLLRHGDGTLALFNGMGFIAPDRLAALLAYDDVNAQAPSTRRIPAISGSNATAAFLSSMRAACRRRILDAALMPAASASNSRSRPKNHRELRNARARVIRLHEARRGSPLRIRP